jgi:hypothetical protein
MYKNKEGRTKEIMKGMYENILYIKQYYSSMSAAERTGDVRAYTTKYQLRGNMKNHCLVQQSKGKLLPCAIIEDYFDIIEKYHKKIGRGKQGKLMKSIHSDYYGIS